jgi:hypothetical protein
VLDPEIIGIVWHEAGEHLFLLYAEGEPERLVATEAVAARLAADIGLDVEVRSHGAVRWTRQGLQAPQADAIGHG